MNPLSFFILCVLADSSIAASGPFVVPTWMGKVPGDSGCQSDQFRCAGGSYRQCISLWQLCNGKVDCFNGIDESSTFCQQATNVSRHKRQVNFTGRVSFDDVKNGLALSSLLSQQVANTFLPALAQTFPPNSTQSQNIKYAQLAFQMLSGLSAMVQQFAETIKNNQVAEQTAAGAQTFNDCGSYCSSKLQNFTSTCPPRTQKSASGHMTVNKWTTVPMVFGSSLLLAPRIY